MALLLNNLGSYATIEAVWANHPEGGREGDYVTVGGSVYYWDKNSRCWVQSSVTPSGGGGTQVVSGDLSVSGNLGVGGNAVISGTLTVNGVPITGGSCGGSGSGQVVYKSIVFKRNASKPSTPTGGAYGNPVPSGWYDGIPGGTDPIWMSSRIFTSDGASPQQDYWTAPALMSDTENMDVEFSPAPTTSVPAAPSSENEGTLWFDPVQHPTASWSSMNWMATRTKYLDSNGNAVWSSWKIILIKGEQGEAGSDGANGDGVQSIFTIASTQPETPTGSNPRGWYSSVSSLTLVAGTALWMSERRCVAGTWGSWSVPVRISGFDGANGSAGEDGADIEFIYKQSNALPGVSETAPESVNTDDDVPTGWSDNPSGVSTTYKYEWMCQRIKPAGSDTWGDWVGPFVWSAYGDKGMDGDGLEYIYRRDANTPATSTLANPSYSYTKVTGPNTTQTYQINNYRGGVVSVNNVWYPENWDFDDSDLSFLGWSGGSYSNGEWVPNGWTDDPAGVDSTHPKEWVATRKRHDGSWGNWSAPALWATYSTEHTIEINSQGFWVIDGVVTTVKAEGQDGTGVSVKGSVNYLTSAQATADAASIGGTPTSLQGITADSNITKTVGDCYVVDYVDVSAASQSSWVRGHIYVYNGSTSSTWSDKWSDLGQFRGEPGQSQYMHLAWATNVVYNNGTPTVTGFSLTNTTGDYDWMGILVDDDPNDSTTATDYEWNYIKGIDGYSQEFVYIRTSNNTNPGLTTSYPDSNTHTNSDPEFLPQATDSHAEQKAAASNAREYNDDPTGVSHDWPYEWMSTRKRDGDGEWGDWSPPALWAVWSESQTYIDTNGIEQIVVDCGNDGRPKGNVSVSFTSKLFYGSDQCKLTTASCSVTENTAGTISTNYPIVNSERLTAESTYSIQSMGTLPVLSSGSITIVLTGEDSNNVTRTATKVIPVISNRDGMTGPIGPAIRFRGAWSANANYVNDGTIKDAVKYNGTYWLLALTTTSSGSTTNAPANNNSQWQSLGNMGFVASDLLLAENGAINLLSSNVINLFNSSNKKTASINADQNGSYCIYYTESPYGKRMEFCYDGWIYYYNNDADNTVEWMLGKNGVIIKMGNVILMNPISLSSSKLTVGITIDENTSIQMATRYVYSNTSSQYNGMVYQGNSLNGNNEPNYSNPLTSGTYALSSTAYAEYDESTGTTTYRLPVCVISGGKITQRTTWPLPTE